MLRFLMVLVGLVFANLAMAVPAMMNYQGQLFLNGSPAAGPVSVTFRLYDAQTNGTLLWTETDVVQVQNGLFSTILGDGTTLPYLPFSGQTLWLETEVSGTTLSPRTQFVSTPYAYRSQRADTATVALNGMTTGGQWETDATNVWRAAGNVGIGNASPAFPLDMVGGLKIRLQPTGNNSGMSFNTAAESPSIGFHASDNSQRFTLATSFSANNLDDLLRFNGNPASDIFVLKGNGNVGLGTSSPVEQLHLERSSGTAAVLLRSYVPGTGTFGAIQFQNTLATGAGIAAQITAVRPVATWGQESDMIFSTNPGGQFPSMAERVRITRDGNVGIGTAVPGTRLELKTTADGIATSGSTAQAALRLRGTTFSNTVLDMGIGAAGVGNNTWLQATDVNDLSQQYVLSLNPNGGNVGIGTANPTAKLHVIGDFCATGSKNRLVHDDKFGDLYYNSVESGEAIFSTSGRAKLNSGRCHVELDRKWLAGVTIDEQYPLDVASVVFYGPHGNWYAVPGQLGFTIIDPSGSNAEFFWTVQARQKGYEDVYLNRPQQTAAK